MTEGVPVDVAVDIPRLELDRPFTYLLPTDRAPGIGLLVSVRFHGRTIRAWVLGPSEDPPGRVLPVRRVLSLVPLFDRAALQLYRWISQRYVVPLSVVIGRAHPPRVASEESDAPASVAPISPPPAPVTPVLGAYPEGPGLLAACNGGSGVFVVRPLPDHEGPSCLETVAATLGAGRDAVVLVPETEPLPATARAVIEAFGEAALLFVGGERRWRYRSWLDLMAGRYRVVVGTRPAVFAPLRRPGLFWIHREAHPGHREERAPYHHVREVAAARAQLQGAVCVLAGLSPSAEAVTMAEGGRARVVRASRATERSAAPAVELARPEREDRSPSLARLLRRGRGAFILVSRLGYGVVRVCRDCGQSVRCPACSGPVTVREGQPACTVCGAPTACQNCGSRRMGVERGGIERVQEWAAGLTGLPSVRVESAEQATPPQADQLTVGTAAAVKDFGPLRIGAVAIVDADRARRRAGLAAPEQVLATWMEAAVWAGPRGAGGRVLVQTEDPGDPAIQALVRWDPWHLHRAEYRRREEAGFPPGFPVFRVAGGPDLPDALASLRPVNLLRSSLDGQEVCLVTLRPEGVPRFRERARTWAEDGTVTRVEAEPQL